MRVGDVDVDAFVLEVHECDVCGFHLGVDASYLEQVGSVDVECPACGADWHIEEFE